jgi:hypothetical protein
VEKKLEVRLCKLQHGIRRVAQGFAADRGQGNISINRTVAFKKNIIMRYWIERGLAITLQTPGPFQLDTPDAALPNHHIILKLITDKDALRQTKCLPRED